MLSRALPVVVFALICVASACAQDSARAVIVSAKVGETIDRDEREMFRLFPAVPDFHEATFFALPDGWYAARVRHGTAEHISDTLVWYSDPALSAVGEQVDHFDELAEFHYALGSRPQRLYYGRMYPISLLRALPGYSKKPSGPAPARVTTIPGKRDPGAGASSNTGDSREEEGLSGLYHPALCGKTECVIPRICDTLDGYAWRYFNFVPEWRGVTHATFERDGISIVLRASTANGDSTRRLSLQDGAMLAAYLETYEQRIRHYGGGNAPTHAQFAELTDTFAYRSLFDDGVLGVPLIGSGDGAEVSVVTAGGNRLRGRLLFASTAAVYLWGASADWSAADSSEVLLRIPVNGITRIVREYPGNFLSGFGYGAGVSFPLLAVLLTSMSTFSNSGRHYMGTAALPSALALSLVGGVVGGSITSSPHADVLSAGHQGLPDLVMVTKMRAAEAFSIAPPELRSMADAAERRWMDETAFAWYEAGVAGRKTAPDSIVTAAKGRQQRIVTFEFAFNAGFNFYLSDWSDPNIDRSNEDSRTFSAWIGLDVAARIHVLRVGERGVAFSIRPHAGFGTNCSRLGVDMLFHAPVAFYLLAGIDYQHIHEALGVYRWDAEDTIDQPRTLDNLFFPFGIGCQWGGTFIEAQLRLALGRPLHIEYTPGLYWPVGTPPDHFRGFTALLVRFGWTL